MSSGELLFVGVFGGAALAALLQVAGFIESRVRGVVLTATVAGRAGFTVLALCTLCFLLLALGFGK
jgi:hypothetical protein